MEQIFEIVGYHLDFYLVDSTGKKRFMFSTPTDQDTNRADGWGGRQYNVAQQDIKYKNKVIKRGQQFMTEQVPVCGKWLHKNKIGL